MLAALLNVISLTRQAVINISLIVLVLHLHIFYFYFLIYPIKIYLILFGAIELEVLTK